MMDWIVCSNLWNCYNYSKTILPHRGIYAMHRIKKAAARHVSVRKLLPNLTDKLQSSIRL